MEPGLAAAAAPARPKVVEGGVSDGLGGEGVWHSAVFWQKGVSHNFEKIEIMSFCDIRMTNLNFSHILKIIN